MLLRRYHENNKRAVEKAAPSLFDDKESVKESPAENNADKGFTREEIEKMQFFKVKSMAKKLGIDVENRESKEIKADVIRELGL